MLASTLYHGNQESNQYQMRDMTLYAGAAGIVLYIKSKVEKGKIEISFVVKFRSPRTPSVNPDV